MALGSNFTLKIIRNTDQMLDLRSAWEKEQDHPDIDFVFFATLLRTRSEILRPHIVVAKSNTELRTLLVGRVEIKHVPVTIGYARIPLPPLRCLTLVGSSLLGDRSDEVIRAIIDSIKDSLRNKEFDIVWLHQFDSDSSFCKAARKSAGLLTRDFFPTSNDHWSVTLPGSYAEFMQKRSSNARHNAKRYKKRLLDFCDGKITVRKFDSPDNVELLINDTETIARKTYHRALKVGFADSLETRERVLLYATQGRLKAYILYIADQPIAFWNGFQYEDTFYTWTTGYDPQFAEFRPGLFLLHQVLEDLCQKGIRRVDFGSGDAQYKRDWCDANVKEVSFFLFGKNIWSMSIAILRIPFLGCSEAARWILQKTNLLPKVRSIWRSRLMHRPNARSSQL